MHSVVIFSSRYGASRDVPPPRANWTFLSLAPKLPHLIEILSANPWHQFDRQLAHALR